MRKKGIRRKSGRLSLRLKNEALVDDIHDYAARNKTTVTALVEKYFEHLLEQDQGPLELEQG